MFNCLCECGGTKVAWSANLKNGYTASCGCLRKESLAGIARRMNRTHGMCETSIYKQWGSMLNRCNNPANPNYPYYGGRGIKVAPEWMSFDRFNADMGERPTRRHTLDRFPDNNGNYGPGNCRWATPMEQGNNKRNNYLITHEGETKTLAQWARLSGIDRTTLKKRHIEGKTGAELFGPTHALRLK